MRSPFEITDRLSPRFTVNGKHGRPVNLAAAVDGVVAALRRDDDLQQDLGLATASEVTTDDIADALALLPDVRNDLERQERELIEAWMDRGGTWAAAATRLDFLSGDALRHRYRRIGGTRTWPAGRPGATTSEGGQQ